MKIDKPYFLRIQKTPPSASKSHKIQLKHGARIRGEVQPSSNPEKGVIIVNGQKIPVSISGKGITGVADFIVHRQGETIFLKRVSAENLQSFINRFDLLFSGSEEKMLLNKAALFLRARGSVINDKILTELQRFYHQIPEQYRLFSLLFLFSNPGKKELLGMLLETWKNYQKKHAKLKKKTADNVEEEISDLIDTSSKNLSQMVKEVVSVLSGGVGEDSAEGRLSRPVLTEVPIWLVFVPIHPEDESSSIPLLFIGKNSGSALDSLYSELVLSGLGKVRIRLISGKDGVAATIYCSEGKSAGIRQYMKKDFILNIVEQKDDGSDLLEWPFEKIIDDQKEMYDAKI